jgi:hypothetical protein
MADLQKKTLKINFCDFYIVNDVFNDKKADKQKIMRGSIKRLIGDDYDIEFCENPDFLFCYCHGSEFIKYHNCVKIYFYDENIVPDFNYFDYAIGMHDITFRDRHLYIPYYQHFLELRPLDRSNLDNSLTERKFCNFVYHNAASGKGAVLRREFCKKLMEYKHIDCPGQVMNNMENGLSERFSNDWERAKIGFLKNYKFTIAFENSFQFGYTTEKLYQPFMANSVPIYWGNPDVTADFNPKAFINCNEYDNNFDDVIKRVIELDNDNDLYMKMLRENPLNKVSHMNRTEKIKKFLAGIFAKGNKPFYKDEMGFNVASQIISRKDREISGLMGLRSVEEHVRLQKIAQNGDLKLVTFGLTERNAKVRNLDFINAKNVLANFDNDKSKWGKDVAGIKTLCPDTLPEFTSQNGVEDIIIMADAFTYIADQLDAFGVKYYSHAQLRDGILPTPRKPPILLFDEFTMNRKMAYMELYFDYSAPPTVRVTREMYSKAFSRLNDRSFEYYGEDMLSFYDALKDYPVADKNVLIFGLTGCNCEAMALWKNAKHVYVVDYNKPICEHEKITVLTYDELDALNIDIDFAFSFSSFEHDGLGRYGDTISPNGDLKAMEHAKKLINEGGIMFLGVPLGRDCLVWNAHRIYGNERLPLLLKDWLCLDAYSHRGVELFERPLGDYTQPILVLENMPKNNNRAIFKRLGYSEDLIAGGKMNTKDGKILQKVLTLQLMESNFSPRKRALVE